MMSQQQPPETLLDAIDRYYDNFPLLESRYSCFTYDGKDYQYCHFKVGSRQESTIGYVLSEVAEKFAQFDEWTLEEGSKPDDEAPSPACLILTGGDDKPSRTEIVEKTLEKMRSAKTFAILEKRTDNKSKLSANDAGEASADEVDKVSAFGPEGVGNVLFAIERSAAPLLGIVTYGVHYVAHSEGEPKIWIQDWNCTENIGKGSLYSTVSGIIVTGKTPVESLLGYAPNDASLGLDDGEEPLIIPEAKERWGRLRSAIESGTFNSFHVRHPETNGEPPLLQPSVQFRYDGRCKANSKLENCDSAIPQLRSVNLEEVNEHLLKGHFEPSCALAIVDYMLSRGLFDRSSALCRDLCAVESRLQRRLRFPLWRAPETRP